MAGIKISALPAIPSSQLTDVAPFVQGGVTYKVTNNQLITLFNSNIQITEGQVTNLTTDLAAKLDKSGGTMTGALILNTSSPTTALEAASKGYVDTIASGITVQGACYAASTTALTVSYNNGVAGVGATLTNATTQATFSIDGVTPPLNSRILIKDQASTLQNGIYTVTNVGSGATNWVLTRATDYDQASEINPGDLVIINNGTVNGDSSWLQTATVTTIGTDPITFSVFFEPSNYLSSTMTSTQIYIGNGSNVGALHAISGDATMSNTGVLTIANSAVTNAKLANMADQTIKGNVSGGSAAPVDLTQAQVLTFLGGTTGTGALVRATSPTLVTPALGVPASGDPQNMGAQNSVTLTATGVSGTATATAYYQKIGKMCFISFEATGDFTSNDTTFTMTGLPYTAGTTANGNQFIGVTRGRNNSADVFGTVWATIADGGTTVTFSLSGNASGWTNSGGKLVNFRGFYWTT